MVNPNNNSSEGKKKKKTQGQRKIEIKKIEKVPNRLVTLTKRRAGLFRKASELCILTGAETAIIADSSGKRIHAFGHPNVDSVIQRFTEGSSTSSSRNNITTSLAKTTEIDELRLEYNSVCEELEIEKKKLESQEKGNDFWWEEENIEHMGLEELEEYCAALEELTNNVLIRAHESELMLKKSHDGSGTNINNIIVESNHEVLARARSQTLTNTNFPHFSLG